MTREKERAAPDPTLYRKYRPQVFRDVVGQEHVIRVLSRALETGRVAHAYLLAGPRGTGKTTVARLLAKRLNCEQPRKVESCGRCKSCAAVAAGAHLDLIEIDAASNRGIDDIRALKERISLAPSHGHWKVYIVDEVHMLSKDAFNALLKTLEEPPAHALFVLATTELERVPDTIRSRCQTFVFRRAAIPLIMQRLEGIARAESVAISPEALRIIAGMSQGCFRDAENLFAMLAGISEKEITADDARAVLGLPSLSVIQDVVDTLINRDAEGALAIIRHVAESGNSLPEFTVLLVRYLRALATQAAADVHAESFSPDEEARLKKQASAWPLPDLVTLLRLALRAKGELRDAIYEELPLQLLALEWCGAPREPAEKAPSSHQENRTFQVSATAAHKPNAAATAAAPQKTGIPLEAILERWPAFLRAAASLHPLLLPKIQTTLPVGVRDGTLLLLTDHALFHERLKNAAFQGQLATCFSEAAGISLGVRAIRERDLASMNLTVPDDLRATIADAAARVAPAPEPTLADTLHILGGEVVQPDGTA